MGMTNMTTWDDEGYWNAVFGPTETPKSVAEHMSGGTPQDLIREAVDEAAAQLPEGSDRKAWVQDAYGSVCRQMAVAS